MKKSVLDLVCKERWNEVYKKSIQNELRFPSIAKAEGARLGQIALPFVKYHSVKFTGEKEIYHGVKEKIL